MMKLGAIALLAAAMLFAQPPKVVSKSEPRYSEEARRAGVNASVVLKLTVYPNGLPGNIRVERGAGFGLDEQAVETVRTWQFEPRLKDGQPASTDAHVEVHFRLLLKDHERESVRLNFALPPGVTRPELLKGHMPPTPDQVGDALQVDFTVNAAGKPEHLRIVKAPDQDWASRAVRQMGGWRFRPAMLNGEPEPVDGTFELTVHLH